ncbi:MAG TPA: prepilin peptidase [Candidatus Saccharimonadales bacterium]|nr:prepilin peptidase [Candidatus Saccharimonadales bacterium]
MIIVMVAALGLVFGSFVNAFVWRLHEGKDWLHERSECVHCHHKLAAKDLVPVFSYMMLRGKCRYCHKKIEDSPWVELATMALFLGSYFFWPVAFQGAGLFRFVVWLVISVGLMALVVYDFRWYLLPDKVVFPLAGLAAVQVLVVSVLYHGGWREILGALAGAVIISGTFYAIFQLSQGKWIGGGDVKLGLVLGLLAGGPFNSLLLLFTASVSGMLFSLPLLFTGKASRKSQLPFGPFLIFGLVVVQLFGTTITSWYARHLLYR